MTVLIYVDASKQVGDPDHLQVFANQDAAKRWFEESWGDDVRLSDLEPKFTCGVCGRRGADVRPLLEKTRMGTRPA
jgi:hypothetical protein